MPLGVLQPLREADSTSEPVVDPSLELRWHRRLAKRFPAQADRELEVGGGLAVDVAQEHKRLRAPRPRRRRCHEPAGERAGAAGIAGSEVEAGGHDGPTVTLLAIARRQA